MGIDTPTIPKAASQPIAIIGSEPAANVPAVQPISHHARNRLLPSGIRAETLAASPLQITVALYGNGVEMRKALVM